MGYISGFSYAKIKLRTLVLNTVCIFKCLNLYESSIFKVRKQILHSDIIFMCFVSVFTLDSHIK